MKGTQRGYNWRGGRSERNEITARGDGRRTEKNWRGAWNAQRPGSKKEMKGKQSKEGKRQEKQKQPTTERKAEPQARTTNHRGKQQKIDGTTVEEERTGRPRQDETEKKRIGRRQPCGSTRGGAPKPQKKPGKAKAEKRRSREAAQEDTKTQRTGLAGEKKRATERLLTSKAENLSQNGTPRNGRGQGTERETETRSPRAKRGEKGEGRPHEAKKRNRGDNGEEARAGRGGKYEHRGNTGKTAENTEGRKKTKARKGETQGNIETSNAQEKAHCTKAETVRKPKPRRKRIEAGNVADNAGQGTRGAPRAPSKGHSTRPKTHERRKKEARTRGSKTKEGGKQRRSEGIDQQPTANARGSKTERRGPTAARKGSANEEEGTRQTPASTEQETTTGRAKYQHNVPAQMNKLRHTKKKRGEWTTS